MTTKAIVANITTSSSVVTRSEPGRMNVVVNTGKSTNAKVQKQRPIVATPSTEATKASVSVGITKYYLDGGNIEETPVAEAIDGGLF